MFLHLKNDFATKILSQKISVLLISKFSWKSPPFQTHESGNTNLNNPEFLIHTSFTGSKFKIR
jgi:hypothetical protein